MQLKSWKFTLLFVVCCLCSHTDSSRSRRGLLAPVNISTKISGDEVKVHWKDHNQPELVSGAYAAVSEINGDKLGPPVFIQANDVKSKSITLSGLTPQMTYSIRVVLFSKDGNSVSSTPVTVTMNSYLGKDESATDPQVVIEVNHVTDHSAMFSWTFPVKHSIHGLQFKLNCNGQQAFLMNGRAVHKKYQTKSYISDALSKYTQEHLVDDLVPNVNYTCQLAAYNTATAKAFLMATTHFTTLVGKPRPPEKPQVDVDNFGIKILLTATTDQFGPISHYTLIAVPVRKDKSQPITAQFTPLIPYNMVVHKAMPSRSASKSDKSVAFVIDTYPGDGLPSEVVLGNTNEVLSAFKPNQFYVLVLAAFTKTKENPKSLFSLSSPSFPPFVISNSLYMYVTQHAEDEAVSDASRIVLWTTGTIAIFGLTVTILSLSVAYTLKRKGYKIPLRLSDEDVDGDYDGLTADNLVYGEKTYAPMKSVHMDQSTRVASGAANQFDNPYFNVSVNRTKGLLEDIQVAMDCTENSTAAENPPHSPTEYCQTPTIFKVQTEEVSLAKSNKTSHSPFTYSTPGELEKLQTGTFSLPRSTGPIKTPRRRVTAVTKSPLNKGIPTPAPCKPKATNIDEEPLAMSNEPLITDIDEDPSPIAAVNDEHPPEIADNIKQPLIIADDVEKPSIVASNNIEPLIKADNEEDLESVTTDEYPPTPVDNVELAAIVDNDEESLTVEGNESQLTTAINNDKVVTADNIEQPSMAETNELLMRSTNEEPLTMASNNEQTLTTANDSEQLQTTANSNEMLTTANINDAVTESLTESTDDDKTLNYEGSSSEEHASEQI